MTTNKRLQFGFNIPPFGPLADPATLVELAVTAEANGWDGMFLWDHPLFNRQQHQPILDPWIALAAIATQTTRINIGPLITPLPRRRPWQIARLTASLDHLSHGRVVLGVGLGFDGDFEPFGEETDHKVRAAMLEESLAIITGLWSGEPFSFDGEHYNLDEMVFLPQPVQQPRIPIWVGGVWPAKPPMRRAARWDGAYPAPVQSIDDWRDILAYIKEHRTSAEPFDVVHGGKFPADPAEASALAAELVAVGVTWWVQDCTPMIGGLTWEDDGWIEQIAPLVMDQIASPPPVLAE